MASLQNRRKKKGRVSFSLEHEKNECPLAYHWMILYFNALHALKSLNRFNYIAQDVANSKLSHQHARNNVRSIHFQKAQFFV
jgi:hypothetical protein